ncbi:hypothetical protein L2E82_24759 [Cichorium intybus]|uniref:Uncharacterized protein n=1 Tax=Cichorium intybus TaxID=13427 RepID=A0ACB9E176_CICIN|nr:hypothetical protein L2E82_24759 [Cichorium intybus]
MADLEIDKIALVIKRGGGDLKTDKPLEEEEDNNVDHDVAMDEDLDALTTLDHASLIKLNKLSVAELKQLVWSSSEKVVGRRCRGDDVTVAMVVVRGYVGGDSGHRVFLEKG